ncbi:MAG: transketolase C-terminal domain-containing protein [Candidatus Borkfalkiaceae bacterium]|nr:transketolase C-terminal domain-containing protein [Christensenellaceae bacterium]
MVNEKYKGLEMRKVYGDTMIKLAEKNDKIVVIDCDLSLSMGTKEFYSVYPERAFNVGIQEANACCVAAGLSTLGYVPFVHTLAVFATRRICDQIFLSCSYAGRNVKIIGGDSGICATMNGGTHMAFEDIGVLRSIPDITIVEPTDNAMMAKLLPIIAGTYGVFYVRYPRRMTVPVYDDNEEFTIGKAKLLKDGSDITIIASGLTVSESLNAAKMLEADGISARVVDMFTIKPIDREIIIDSALKTGAILTVENHNVNGGLGSAVSEVLSENCPTLLKRMGVNEEFGEVGAQDYLADRYKLTAKYIYEESKNLLKKKAR